MAIRTAPNSRPVLEGGSVCLIKTSDEQVHVWMGPVLEAISPATGVLKLHIWTPAIGLLPLLLQRLAGNRGLQNLSWQPGVGAREEVPKGASQALTGNKSYSS